MKLKIDKKTAQELHDHLKESGTSNRLTVFFNTLEQKLTRKVKPTRNGEKDITLSPTDVTALKSLLKDRRKEGKAKKR